MLTLETERLLFRQWREDDFKYFQHYFSDENLSRFIGGMLTPEDAWRVMATYIGHYQLKGFGALALEEKETRNFVGTVGLWKSEPWPELELAYWLWPAAHGKGYATEAGVACRDFAKHALKAPSLVSYIDPRNHASIKVAERLGATFDQEIDLLSYGLHRVYRYW